MNDVWRWGLASLVAIQMLFTMPRAADAGWRTVPTTGFVTTDRQITLVNTIGALWLRSDQTGNAFRVYQTVPTFEGDVIDAIAVCYRAEPGGLITAIGLVEFLTPGDSTGSSSGHFDDTNLNSNVDTCYVSPVANYAPAGTVNLYLKLQFTFLGGTIYVGTVAVHTK